MSAWIANDSGWGKILSWAIRQLSRLIWKTWPTLYSQLTLLETSLLHSQAIHATPRWWQRWWWWCCCSPMLSALLYDFSCYCTDSSKSVCEIHTAARTTSVFFAIAVTSHRWRSRERRKKTLLLIEVTLFLPFYFARIFIRLLSCVHFVDIYWYRAIHVSHVFDLMLQPN